MVSFLTATPDFVVGWLMAQAGRPLFLRLDPEDRVRVVSALAALIMLGFTMILLVSWGARATRRYMNRPVRGQRASGQPVDDWARKPLNPDDDWNEESTESHE